MNDIYSPPEADISVDEDVAAPTVLKSLGGFILSFAAAYVLIYLAGFLYGLVVPLESASVSALYGSLLLSFGLHVAWVIAWPMYCKRRGWPNLYRGGRWHRIFLVVLLVVAVLGVVVSSTINLPG